MGTQWVVTNSAERIMFANGNHAETTFTVSNQGRLADRVVFDLVPGDGADRAWFTVEDPQRLVPATGSVAYLVSVDPPTDAPAGSYSVQGRVYSADSAPEEDSVLSGRILFDVGAPAPKPKPKPWWLIAVAAMVVLVIGVVIAIVVGSGGDDSPPAAIGVTTPPPQPTSAAPVRVPNLASLTQEQATTELTNAGLAVGTVKHRHNPAQAGKVMEQSTAATTTVPAGTTVDLVVGVNLAAPDITAPGNGATFGGGSRVDVRWNQTETWVGKWHITTQKENCYYYIGHEYRDCRWDAQANVDATTKIYNTSFDLGYQPLLNLGNYNTGKVRAIVSAVDDFGTAGPSKTVEYWIR
jgi:hypothetical protein